MCLQSQDPRPTPSDATQTGEFPPSQIQQVVNRHRRVYAGGNANCGRAETGTHDRLTPAGREQQATVTTRFENLCAQVSSQFEAVRRNLMQPKAIDCPVQGCFQPQTPDNPGQEKIKCIFCDRDFMQDPT